MPIYSNLSHFAQLLRFLIGMLMHLWRKLGIGQQGLVLLTALLASIGEAGIPMAGLVMLVVVLQTVGLPLEGIGTIIAVDRILDMMQTATNVWSDLVGTAVFNHYESGAPEK